jgi:hypothetical protein
MIRYERTEVGRGLTVVVIGTVVLMLAAFLPMILEVISGKSHPGILAVIVMPLIMTSIILPGITKLSIQLTDETLQVRMGVFSRKIDLRDVTKVSIVLLPWWSGWGVRYSLTGAGELWRVSGTRAIKLELRNHSRFSLGLENPESLETVLQKILEVRSDSKITYSASNFTP